MLFVFSKVLTRRAFFFPRIRTHTSSSSSSSSKSRKTDCSHDEAKNSRGPNRCSRDNECAGDRTCSSSRWCQGNSNC